MLEAEIIIPATDIQFPSSEHLPTEDDIPLESPWHRDEINLLVESIQYHWRERDDYYAGGNMFIYFSQHQLRNRDYRGPDFYVVQNVDGNKKRGAWIVWEEEGRYPDVIIELLSPSTAKVDKTIKKELYEHVFHTPEYFCYDPTDQTLIGWRLHGNQYQPILPNEENRLWSEVLQLWLGHWPGVLVRYEAVWLRFFDQTGQVIPLTSEAARTEAEAARTEVEAANFKANAEAEARQAAEAELQQLRQELAQLKGQE